MTNNEYGKVFKRAWGDRDFKTLTATEQLLYVKLISQSDISLAGVLTLAPVRWATQTAGMDVEDVSRDLAGLARRNYVLIDADTQEVLVRSYVRNDLGWKSPRTMIGIANAIGRILSPSLRVAIARELGRLDTDALSSTINEKTGRSTREVVESIIGDVLADTPSDALPDTPSDGVSDTPSDTPSDGVSAVRTLNDNCNNSGSGSGSGKNNICPTVADAPAEPIKLDPDAPAPQSRKKPATPLPVGWTPSNTNVTYADEHDIDWQHEAAQFQAHHLARDSRFVNWDQAFRTWLGNADKWRRREEPRRLVDDSWDHLKRDPDEDVA